ncbi:hypothetical protein WB66_17980 [bacteria symbiont BFo1 of Frankliniella occidentalis]|nr:hypothetical protein WB66_17980 [bacteria symbiont BFo1 of Frankliniella occidentalis]
MSLENTNIAVVEKNTIVKAEALRSAKAGSAVKIKAVEGGKYILAQGENGIAPENITVQRVGKDLHVMLEGTDANSPQLIIEDYFDKPGELVGKGEDGQWHQFISTDGDSQHDAAFLIDGETSPLALGANSVASLDGIAVAEGAISPALLALGALAALAAAFGLGYLIAHHNKDNSISDTGDTGVIDDSHVPSPNLGTITDNTGAITGPLVNGQHTDETQPVFSGTGTAGNTVVLRDGGVIIGSAIVQPDGSWSVKPTAPLAEGNHNFDLVERDAAGNTSQPTTPVTIIVDLTVPDPATGLLLTDNVGLETGEILPNTTTDDTTPTYSGKAEPRSVVYVYDGTTPIGSALTNAAGEWTFTPREPLSSGEHSLTTVVQDEAGNRSQPTPPLVFVIDPNGLSATITGAFDDTGATRLELENGAVTKDNTPILSGTATARSIVFIYEEGNPTAIGSVRTLGNGTWTFTAPELAEGHHAFVAIPQDASGTRGNQSAPFELDIDTQPPTRPGLNNDGIESIWDDVGLIQGKIPNGGSTDDTTPTLRGSHQTPGDIVYVYDNNGTVPLGSALVGPGGAWDFSPNPPLNQGNHNFTIVVADPAGNRSEPSDPWLVIIDTTPPPVPAITHVVDDAGTVTGDITPGGTTDDAWPTVKGTAQANSLVMIYDRMNDGSRVLLGSTLTNASGEWEFTPNLPLNNGHHSLSAVALDEVRNTSAESARFDFDLVTGGIPSAPAINYAWDDVGSQVGSLQSGDVTDDTRPTLHGTAPADTLVTIYVDHRAVASFSAGPTGRWSWTPDAALAEGTHNFSATSTDTTTGNVSAPTADFALKIDITPPDAAENLHLDDNVAPSMGEILPGSTTDDNTPTFSGTAEPGATVIVIDNGREIGRAPVNGDGSWSFTPGTSLGDGHHEFSAVVEDPAGNRSTPTTPIGFDIDTSAVFVSIDYALDDAGTVTHNLRSGDATNDATPTLVGKAKPNAIVELFDGTTSLGSVQANGQGEWTFTSPNLSEGLHHITATATDDAHATATSTQFDLNIDLTAPGTGSGIGEVWDNVGPVQGLVPANGATDDTTPTLRGSGLEPGDVVTVRDGDQALGTAIVKEDGTWTFTPASPLPDGPHDFTIVVTDPVGNASLPSDPYTVIIDTDAPASPIISQVVDNEGGATGPIVPGSVMDDPRPEISGTAVANSLVSVYSNNQLIGTAQAGPDGRWTLTPEFPLPLGDNSLRAVASDAVGNHSTPSDPFDFTLATGGIPSSPSIIGANDDVGVVTGVLHNNAVTDDVRPELFGNAPALSLVYITVDGVVQGSVKADSHGQWKWTPATDLSEAEHTFSVAARDSLGNVSAPSGEFKLVIDITPPAAASGELTDNVGDQQGVIVDNSTTDDTTPTYNGTALPGSLVFIRDGDLVIGSAQVSPDGSWTFTPEHPLAPGAHEFSTVVQDPAGNRSAPGDVIHFIVDPSAVMVSIDYVRDDAGSVQGNLVSGQATDDTTPTLVGKATPNAIVFIYDGSDTTPIGSVQASPFGDWEFTPASALAAGAHSFTATVTNAAGNSSTTAAFDLEIDLTAPDNHGIGDIIDNEPGNVGSIPDGGSTNDSTPTLIGSGQQPGDTVTVRDGGEPIGTAIVRDDGSWEFTPTTPLPERDHHFDIIVTDPVGNSSAPSDPWTVVIDVTAPLPPVITQLVDDQGDLTGDIARGDLTDDARPQINGTAEPDSLIVVSDNGVVIGSTVTRADGGWTLDLDADLTGPNHSLTAKATDKAGNTGVESDAWDFRLAEGGDAEAQPPVIVSGFDDVEPNTGELVSGDATNDQRPQLSGTGHAGDVIELFDGTTSLGTTIVRPDNTWSMEPNQDLSEGHHSLTARATNDAGNQSAPSAAFELDVDLTAPVIPATGGIGDILDDEGSVTGSIPDGGATDDRTPTLIGNGLEPGDTVKVYDGEALLGTATVQPDGSWSYTPDHNLDAGGHEFTIIVADPAGNESAPSDPRSIVIDLTPPPAPAITQLVDDQGDLTGDIARGGLTDDARPEIHGTAEAGSLVTVYDNGVIIGSALAQPDGSWVLNLDADLTGPDHALTATARNAVGNVSAPSAEFDFRLAEGSAVVAEEPVITGGYDDAEPKTGDLASGDATNDQRPLIRGTGHAGDVIELFDGTTSLGTTTVGPDNTWSMEPNQDLSKGHHSLTARATNEAGNHSTPSNAFDLDVDLTPPTHPGADDDGIRTIWDDTEPFIGDIANGGSTNDVRPTLMGDFQDTGSIIYVYDNGELLGTAIVRDTGDWDFTPDRDLAEGDHVFTIVVEDRAGLKSDTSDPYAITIDITPPEKPLITSVYDDQGAHQANLTPGEITDDAQPDISGTAQPNSVVFIYDGTTLLGSAAVNGTGDWTFTPTPLAMGEHNINVVARDAAGLTSEPSDPFDFYVLTGGVPSAVAITSVIDDVGTQRGNVPSNGFTDDTQPTVNGTAPADTLVTVTLTGPGGVTVVGTAISSPEGIWSFSPPVLGQGRYNIVAEALDPALNPISSGNWVINIDTTPPPAPVISTVMDDVAGGIVGNLPNGSVTNDNRPTLNGTAEAGTVIRVYDGSTLLGSAVATGGNWTFTTPVLSNNPHSLTATATDAAGNISPATAARTFTVDTSAPPVAISTVMDNVAGGIVGNLPNGSVTNDSTPTLNGTGENGSVVRIYDNGSLIGSTTVSGGAWSYTLAAQGNGTSHSLTATATDAAGNTSAATAARTFTVDTAAPPVAISSVMDNVAGGIVGNLPNGSVTNDSTPTLNGTGENGSVVRIYDNGSLIGSTTVSGGAWSYTMAAQGNNTAHSLTATATDAAGNVSAATAARTFTVDTAAPAAPVVSSVEDNGSTPVANIVNGGSTDDNTPVLHGTAEAGAIIRIAIDGTVYSTTATGGVWNFTTPTLSLGAHNFSITATDAAGNTSAATARSLNVVSPVPDGLRGTENFEYSAAQQTAIVSGSQLASGLVISCSWSGYAIMTVVGQGHHAQIYASATHATRLTWGTGKYTTDVHFDLVAPTATAPMQPTVVNVYSSTGTLLSSQVISSASRFNYEAPPGQKIASVQLYVQGSTDAAPALVGFDNVSWGENASGTISTAGIMAVESHDQPMGLESVDQHTAAQATPAATADHDAAAAQGNEQHAQPAQPAQPVVEEPSAAVAQPAQPHAGITLTLEHAEQPIDFSAVVAAGETVSKVNMTNAKADVLNITLDDVLTHGEANAFIADGAKQMLIQGERGDVVNLSDLLPEGAAANEWNKANSPVTVDGVQYEVYQHGSNNDAELLVQMGVQLNLNNH